MKEILTKKRGYNTPETIALTQECSAFLQRQPHLKNEDSGSFSIPYTIGTIMIDKALCDLSASVSVMPLAICQKLNMGSLKYTSMTLQMADCSVKYPLRILEDVSVKVGKFFIPVDFVLIDMTEDAHILIVLGRPFLNTAGTVIDVHNVSLTLDVGGEKAAFTLTKGRKRPMIEEKCDDIDMFDSVIGEYVSQSPPGDPLKGLKSVTYA
ncbi:hypothetical protein vseg_008000 [Gypsophila vaccaria]